MLAGLALVAATGCEDAVDEGDTPDLRTGQVEQGASVICTAIQRVGPTLGVEDAQIVSDPTDPTRANTNFGALTQMTTGFVSSDVRRVLFKFDLSSVPPGSVVQSATLGLRMIQSPGKAPVDIHAVTTSWSESSVTWNQIGSSFDPLPVASLATLGVPNNSNVSIDLTPLTVLWLSGARPNNGVLLDHPLPGRTSVGASDAGPLAPRPRLTVCYTPPSCLDGVQNQGELGIDCGGPCAHECAHPPATDVVSGAGEGNSPHFKAIYTIGQPTQNQDQSTSPGYRAQGGLIGANGSLP